MWICHWLTNSTSSQVARLRTTILLLFVSLHATDCGFHVPRSNISRLLIFNSQSLSLVGNAFRENPSTMNTEEYRTFISAVCLVLRQKRICKCSGTYTEKLYDLVKANNSAILEEQIESVAQNVCELGINPGANFGLLRRELILVSAFKTSNLGLFTLVLVGISQ